MDSANEQKKLLFMRRALWWLPCLVFALWASVLTATAVSAGLMTLADAVIQALVAGIVVGVLVTAAYFGYKYLLERSPSTRA